MPVPFLTLVGGSGEGATTPRAKCTSSGARIIRLDNTDVLEDIADAIQKA